MPTASTVEQMILNGMVLDRHGRWVTIDEAVVLDDDYRGHVEAGEVLCEGHWVDMADAATEELRVQENQIATKMVEPPTPKHSRRWAEADTRIINLSDIGDEGMVLPPEDGPVENRDTEAAPLVQSDGLPSGPESMDSETVATSDTVSIEVEVEDTVALPVVDEHGSFVQPPPVMPTDNRHEHFQPVVDAGTAPTYSGEENLVDVIDSWGETKGRRRRILIITSSVLGGLAAAGIILWQLLG